MNLFLMRHGTADPSMSGGRYGLTRRGREEAEAVAGALKHLGLRPSRIWHSAKTRAIETADILRLRLLPGLACELKPGLLPEDSSEQMAEMIEAHAIEYPGENLFIVSHIPMLPSLAFRLLGSMDATPSFPPAGCLWLENPNGGRWKVKNFWNPVDLLT